MADHSERHSRLFFPPVEMYHDGYWILSGREVLRRARFITQVKERALEHQIEFFQKLYAEHRIIKISFQETDHDGVTVFFIPLAITDPEIVDLRRLLPYDKSHIDGKPVFKLFSIMGFEIGYSHHFTLTIDAEPARELAEFNNKILHSERRLTLPDYEITLPDLQLYRELSHEDLIEYIDDSFRYFLVYNAVEVRLKLLNAGVLADKRKLLIHLTRNEDAVPYILLVVPPDLIDGVKKETKFPE
jgi:hypothetical protein